MQLSVNEEMEKFSRWPQAFAGSRLRAEAPIPFSLRLTPPGQPPGQKHLTLMCLVHGNENCGIAVLNELIGQLAKGLLRTPLTMTFIVGNPAAAREGRRMLHDNLNRCFGLSQARGEESARAIEVSGELAKTDFLLDLHQTSGKVDRSFFIFPFAPRPFRYARALDPYKTIVTHWGDPFSKEGMCSDEFVNSRGGCGITLELGQMGFDVYQINDGLACCLRAMQWITAIGEGTVKEDLSEVELERGGELYTFSKVQEIPEGGRAELKPGWLNFQDVRAGEAIGKINDETLTASEPGKIMFPYYPNPNIASKAPKEAWRLLRPLKVADLPWSRFTVS